MHFYFPPKKTHSVWFISVLNYGDTENVLINHLLLVIPMSYPCHYTNLCPHKPHKHAHTHTHTHTHTHIYIYIYIYTGAGHIIRISSKSWFISLIPFKKWNLYNVYIHSTQTDIFQVFISFNFDVYNWQLMKTPNSVSQNIWILWKGSILKTPGATL